MLLGARANTALQDRAGLEPSDVRNLILRPNETGSEEAKSNGPPIGAPTPALTAGRIHCGLGCLSTRQGPAAGRRWRSVPRSPSACLDESGEQFLPRVFPAPQRKTGCNSGQQWDTKKLFRQGQTIDFAAYRVCPKFAAKRLAVKRFVGSSPIASTKFPVQRDGFGPVLEHPIVFWCQCDRELVAGSSSQGRGGVPASHVRLGCIGGHHLTSAPSSLRSRSDELQNQRHLSPRARQRRRPRLGRPCLRWLPDE